MGGRRVIAVDFDGTLFHEDELGELLAVPGAAAALQRMRALGWFIVIHTCRTGLAIRDGRLDAEVMTIEDALVAHGMPFDEIFLGEKLVADLYIDDRSVPFAGDWAATLVEARRRLSG